VDAYEFDGGSGNDKLPGPKALPVLSSMFGKPLDRFERPTHNLFAGARGSGSAIHQDGHLLGSEVPGPRQRKHGLEHQAGMNAVRSD
jgi:hypothetical protein